MMWKYETIQGDTWDILAHDIYGTETLAYVLLQANPEQMQRIFLPSGILLNIPQLPNTIKKLNKPSPPWIRNG